MIPTFPSEAPVPPLPMTRKEAREARLKTFTAMLACRRCGSKQRTVHGSVCCGCLEVEERKRKALAEKVRQRVLLTAEAQVLRKLKREARAATEAAEREAKAQQRAAAKQEVQKQRKANARAAARAARTASATEECQAVHAPDSPPWHESSADADCAAPWD